MKDKYYIWLVALALVLYIVWDNYPGSTITNKAAGNAAGQVGG